MSGVGDGVNAALTGAMSGYRYRHMLAGRYEIAETDADKRWVRTTLEQIADRWGYRVAASTPDDMARRLGRPCRSCKRRNHGPECQGCGDVTP